MDKIKNIFEEALEYLLPKESQNIFSMLLSIFVFINKKLFYELWYQIFNMKRNKLKEIYNINKKYLDKINQLDGLNEKYKIKINCYEKNIKN